jgi:3-oxoacyl-[acyl-carrier protein] reductase
MAMADLLLELGRSVRARKLVGALGLPLPLPQPLTRATGGWSARELEGQRVAVLQLGAGQAIATIGQALGGAGAVALAPEGLLPSFECEDCAPVVRLTPEARLDAVVVDATGACFISLLSGLQRELGPVVGQLRRGGRVVVVGRGLSGLDGGHAAAQGALDGFVRSLAKEIGRRGATVNLVRVGDGAMAYMAAPLVFLLSARAAFITGQPLHIERPAVGQPGKLHARLLVGKVALVTGAARGIGEAGARALAQEGAHVVVLDRPQDGALAREVAASIGGRALLADLTAAGEVGRIVAELGVVDIVVHNAGITRDKRLVRMRPEQWEQVMAVNLDAIVRLHSALLGASALRDGGRVICLSSIAGIAGNMGQTAYAASKAGVMGFVAAEASALAARGITVNAVAPGFVETRMTAAIPAAIRQAGRRLSALSQGGQPRDVADAITFLSAGAAQGITGRTLRVCGGSFLGA